MQKLVQQGNSTMNFGMNLQWARPKYDTSYFNEDDTCAHHRHAEAKPGSTPKCRQDTAGTAVHLQCTADVLHAANIVITCLSCDPC